MTNPPTDPAVNRLPEFPPSMASLFSLVRHEVADFLQVVYSSTAILQHRLTTAMTTERQVLTNLQRQAETCRNFLDTLQDYLNVPPLALDQVDMAELVRQLETRARSRFPHLEFQVEMAEMPPMDGDRHQLMLAGGLALTHAGERAARSVIFRCEINRQNGDVQWTILDDGPPLAEQQQRALLSQVVQAHEGRRRLGLAPLVRVIQAHGGQVHARNRLEGGLAITCTLPRHPQRTPARD